ncbi:MAG TPA: efflux RND transporter periplasmic adaptor subunit, partial [Planctomycetes bacterium]|nr:efflux RND transporter periplasmic adaptor subunit [Planctomycetota bacterium]
MTRTDRIPMRTTSRITLLLLLIAGFALGRWAFPAGGKAPAASGESAAAAPAVEEIWTCAMHPQVRLPEPGQCPICGMDLIPADAGGGSSLGPRDLRMSPDAVALADIQTAKVVRRTVAHDVPMVGKVAYDETRVSTITTWVPGRLEKLFVDYTGVPVRKGEHLVEIYSPTLFSAQQELLQAIVAEKRIGRSSLDILHTASTATVTSTREKLRLYGMTDAQIEELVARGTPDERVTIYAPTGGIVIHKKALEGMYVDEGSEVYTIADLSKVWVFLDAYESDLVWLRYGQDVRFTVEAYPGRTLHGRVAFIDPSLDDRTRTVKVRLNVENEDGLLKPGMFVSAVAEARLSDAGKVVDTNLAGKWMCPMHPEVIGDGPESCPECGMELKPVEELGFITEPDGDPVLVIPATAPLLTGKRAVVYVKLPDREEPTFQGRVVTLGPRAGDWYVVEDGLEEGETVV